MADSWNRREFLQRAAIGITGVSAAAGLSFAVSDRGRNEPDTKAGVNQVRNFSRSNPGAASTVVISNGKASNAVKSAVKTLGGINKFVFKGDIVVVKPNIGWDRTPLQAANTSPVVVKTVVELCFEAGAKEVIVTDNSCNDAARCFTRSGIWKLAEQAGATVVLPAEHRFLPFDLGGIILGEMPVLAPAVQCDCFINLPVAKHHGLSKFTGAMKNLYGVLG